MVVFGFLFVTVASRISGLIGNSSNPVSGMTIATLMATCAIFLLKGWTANPYAVLALTIGGVVCIASAIAGATSQDLKTGFLVGATPIKQQIALVIGVLVSSFAVGGTLMLMNKGLEQYTPVEIPLSIQQLPQGVEIQDTHYSHLGREYVLVNALGSHVIPDGRYLYSADTKQIEIQWTQGIGSEKAAAPQARLMATVINGILNQQLPWRLVLLGVFLVIAVELLGIRSLAVRRGFLSFHRHDHGDVCRRSDSLAVGTRPRQGFRRGKRIQSRLSLCQRADRRRWRLWIAGYFSESPAGSRTGHPRPAMAAVPSLADQ